MTKDASRDLTAVVVRGDAAHLPLPDGSADLIVTSPPYFALRSYADGGEHYDGQIGSEATPRDYLEALWACTAEWMRVLKPGGSIFVNLGDKYAGGGMGGHGGGRLNGRVGQGALESGYTRPKDAGVRDKSLLGLPWRYVLGCVDRLGLILRAEIVWAKPNGLPESVTDRVRRSHEQVFHLVKQPRYYSAIDEIREPHTLVLPDGRPAPRAAYGGVMPSEQRGKVSTSTPGRWSTVSGSHPLGKLPGSVWEIPSAPLTVPERLGVDHFAAYPPELVRRIVLGWSSPGLCTACGEGRRPVTDVERIPLRQRDLPMRARLNGERIHGPDKRAGTHVLNRSEITGYACACPEPNAPTRPSLVVDPFGGTGTTALVASVLGRVGITVDRSGDYCRLAAWRTADPGERARALGVPKPPPVPDGQGSLFDEAG